MKVIQATNCYGIQNGVVVAVKKIHSDLKKLNIKSLILAPNDDKTIEKDVLKVKGIMNKKGYSGGTYFGKNIREEIKDADIFHIHHPPLLIPGLLPVSTKAFGYAKFNKKKIVCHYHTRQDLYFISYVKTARVFPEISMSLARKFNVSYLNMCDCVIAPSKSIKELLKKWGVKTNIEIIPTNIDFNKFKEGNGKKIRRRFGIGEKEIVVSYIGRIEEEKGVKKLLQLEKIKGIRLMFVGSGSQLQELVEKSTNKDTIFTDKVDYSEIQDYFAASDLIINGSKSETQCLTIWEAHSLGKPVIGINSEGVKDYIKNGENGFLVKNVKQMKDKIIELIKDENKMKKLSKGCIKTTLKRKKHQSTKDILKIYNKLIKEKV